MALEGVERRHGRELQRGRVWLGVERVRDGEEVRLKRIASKKWYGVCLWRNGSSGSDDTGEILQNWEAGYLLRTKGDQSEEGGVAAGFGAVDSCCLVDG